ncbi:class I SAM-dependent methyltransferase [Candidatus Parcubacteria bacterium]|nr:MAG: class I SAM-dependent methyltransferase [Candidatus Parcubacteria bacterium]
MQKICVFCNHKQFGFVSKTVRDSEKHKVIKCKNCGHVQLFPIPTINDDKHFYDNNLQQKNISISINLKEIEKKSKADTNRRTELIKKLTPKNGSVLEIGSGYGFFLEKMRRGGYKAVGIEVSKERRRFARKITTAEVLDINLNSTSLDIGQFNTIVMFHVLEHIANPIQFLKNIRRLLKNNGKLVIEVPNIRDLQLKHNDYYRGWYWQRAHIHYFSPIILTKILKESGFKKIILQGTQRYSLENMFHWKLINKPQLENPAYSLSQEYNWLENSYKKYLEKKLLCDTIIAVCSL